jgi:hypothetical protein
MRMMDLKDGNGQTTTATPVEAVQALRARGIDNAENLLEHGTPDQIIAVCRRWDGRQGVGGGLLVKWIRNGEFDEPEPEPTLTPAEQLRARFDEYATRFPVGTVIERHHVLQARRWPNDDPCPGSMTVVDTTYPTFVIECDRCGFPAGVPPRHLHLLDQWARAEPIF